jgi:MMP alpha-(1->4)-mannosyltransferase
LTVRARGFNPGLRGSAVRIVLVGTGVHPIPPPGYGGVERTIAEFSAALRAAGQDVSVVNEVRGGRGLDEYRFAWHLPDRLEAERYDVLHASTPVVANRLALLRRPFVYTTHSRHWFERAGARQRLGSWLERRAVRRAAATVALTDRLARTIRSGVGGASPPRLEVIPIGVDADRFRPAWERRSGTRALGVGVVRPFKRWELAARALRGSGMTLTIAGPTPDPEYAARVVAAGDSVTLVGEVDDATLDRLYAESDLLVHPSRVEILAGVVLQGLAAGLPVLGAEPVADLLEAGVTGWAAPPGAEDAAVVEAFTRWARTLSGDPPTRRRMGEAARASALERFSWRAVVDRHLRLYADLLGRGALSRPGSRGR